MPTTAFEFLQQHGNGARVHLVQSAVSLHPRPWGPLRHDDLWWIEVTPEGIVRLHNTSTGHAKELTPSDVLSAEVDPHAPHDGVLHLRVHLARQLWLRGVNAGWVRRGYAIRSASCPRALLARQILPQPIAASRARG